MSECRSIDPFITPYVDGDIGAAERLRVETHVRACPPCHSRVASERAVRELMRVKRAELAADHVKCFGVMNTLLGTNADAAMIERAMKEMFGWQMHVPESAGVGLELVGARPCLYGKGRAAHLMYRHHGQPVSVFMLPQL